MLYELILIFTLFQHEDDVRRLLAYVDPKLGTPLEEMDYRWVIGYIRAIQLYSYTAIQL